MSWGVGGLVVIEIIAILVPLAAALWATGTAPTSGLGLRPAPALGLVMGALALRSGSLGPAIVAHALNNSLVIVCYRAGMEDPPGAHGALLPLWLLCAALALLAGIRHAHPDRRVA